MEGTVVDVTRALEGFPTQAVGLGRVLQEMALSKQRLKGQSSAVNCGGRGREGVGGRRTSQFCHPESVLLPLSFLT